MSPNETGPDVSDVDWANQAMLPIVGKVLPQFTVWGFILRLDFGAGYLITVEAPLSVTVNGERWAGEPVSSESAAALLEGAHTEVTSATVVVGGALRLTTEHAVLEVQSLPDFESWQFNAPRGVLVVCMPGGGIACFPGDRDQPTSGP